MKQTRGLAWWLFWRYIDLMILTTIVGEFIGGVWGVVAAMNGMEKNAAVALGQLFGFCLGVVATFYALNFILSKMINRNIGGMKLIIVDAASGE